MIGGQELVLWIKTFLDTIFGMLVLFLFLLYSSKLLLSPCEGESGKVINFINNKYILQQEPWFSGSRRRER